MGTSGVPLNKNDIIDAIYAKKGIIKNAAASVPCTSAAIYEWIKNDPDVAFAIKDAREKREEEQRQIVEEAVREAHVGIMELIQKRDITSIIFTLKTKGNWLQSGSDNTLNINLNKEPYSGKRNSDSA